MSPGTGARWPIGAAFCCGLVLMAVGVVAADVCLNPLPGTVGWWKGDGNTSDGFGLNHGVPVGGLGYASGEVGSAFNFTAAGQGVSIAPSSTLNVGAAGLTMEAWINPSEIATQRPIFEYFDGVTLGAHFWINVSYAGFGGPASLYATIQPGTTAYIVAVPGVVTVGVWQHVAFTYDRASGVERLYLNGAEVASRVIGDVFVQTTPQLNLGRRPGGESFAGKLDELGLYDRALSPAELTAIYQAGVGGKCPVTPIPATPLISEGFEGIFPGAWSVGDLNASGVPAFWDDVNAAFGGEAPHTGGWKGYCAGSAYPSGVAANPVYNDSMLAYMDRPFDYTGYERAQLTFWSKMPSIEPCCDRARVWFFGPLSGRILLWESGSAQAAWSPVTLAFPVAEKFGTFRFEFTSDASITAEGWYLDDITLAGLNPPPRDSILSLSPGSLALLEIDAGNDSPGRDREFLRVEALVRSANATSAATSDELVLGFRLLDSAGDPVSIYDSAGDVSVDATLYQTRLVALPPFGQVNQSVSAALRPAVPLLPGENYTLELQLFRGGAFTGVRATNGPHQFLQFQNTTSGDAAWNVLGSVKPVTVARDWAIHGSPGQSGFLVNVTSIVARFDDFDLPASIDSVPLSYSYELIEVTSGTSVPLRNPSTMFTLDLPSHNGAALPGPTFHTNVSTVTLEPAEGEQLDPVDGQYQVRVTLSHDEGNGFSPDATGVSSPRRLFHFSRRLFFGAIEGSFSNLDASPGVNVVTPGDSVALSLRVSAGAGHLTGFPQHTFGDGAARDAWVYVNGDVRIMPGSSYAVTAPVPDNSLLNGICFVRTNLVLSDAGARSAVQLKFPTGFSIGGSSELRLTIGRLGFGSRELNSNLEPVERLLTFNAPIYGVEETKPFWIHAPRLEWRLDDGQIVLPSPDALVYVRQLEDDRLDGARSTLTQPDDADRISNDGYYRGASWGGGDLVVRADANGAARMTANVVLAAPEFRPHFPYLNRATAGHVPMIGGSVSVVDDLIDPAVSRIELAGPVTVPYKRDCLEPDCPAGIEAGRLEFSALGNQLLFTADGGLWADGAVPETNLTWGFVDNLGPGGTPRFAQQAGLVGAGTYHIPGTFLRGDLSTQPSEVRPAVLLFTGVGDGVDPAYTERPGDEPGYRLGWANYAGVNFRSPSTGRSFLAGRDTGPFPLTANAKYYARFGGVSGIHQAESFPNPNLSLSGYPFTFRGYRLSYLDSEVWESLTEGRLTLPAPANFFLDFEKMRFSCRGALESATLPAGTDEKKMEYWETWIQPLSLEFRPSALDLCDPAKRYLVLGVQMQLPVIPDAFQAALAFKSNGNLGVAADKILGVDSRFPVPGRISLCGSGSSLFPVSTAGEGYFNNPEIPGAPPQGFFNLAGRLDLFWFEDAKVHLHVTPKPGSRTEGRVDVMGGWRSVDGLGKDLGWTDGKDNYFTVTKFDQTHRGFPARSGLTLDGYRESATEDWRPRAQREWIELVKFDYALAWDRAAKQFRSFEDGDVELPIIDVSSRLKLLTAGRADIDFSQDVNLGLPRLKLLDFANDAINEINRPLNSLSNAIRGELKELVEKTGVNGGVRALQRTLRENAEAFFRPILEPVLNRILPDLQADLAKSLRDDPANFLRNASNIVASASGDLARVIQTLNGASNEVSSVIGQVSGVLRDVDDTLGLFIRILEKDGQGKRNLIGKIIMKVADDEAGALGFAVGSIVQDVANDLVKSLEPTLAKIEAELRKVQSKLAEVRNQLGAGTGQFNNALGAVGSGGKALQDYLALAGKGVSMLMSNVITPAGDYFTADPARATREIRERLMVAFLSAPLSSKYQQTFRNFLADDDFVVDELMQTLFQQINGAIRGGLEGQLTSARDGIFGGLKGPSFLTQTLLAAKIRGAPEFNGDSMRKLRLDADVQLNIPNEMKFGAYLQVLELDSASSPAGCIPAGGPAAEVTLGALNVPLGWSGFDNGQTANIAARWNIQNGSVYGIGGKFELGGNTKVKGATVKGFAAMFAVGSTEAYLAARASGEAKGIQGEVGFFAGKSCSMDPLKMVDPDMNVVLSGDPLAFRGIYVQYGGRFPLTQLVGIPPSCLLRLDGWANNAIYYDWSVPPVGRLGGRQKVGLDAELLCVLGGSVNWTLFASISGQELVLGGGAEVCGKIGICPFCAEGCAGFTVKGVLNDGGVDYFLDY